MGRSARRAGTTNAGVTSSTWPGSAGVGVWMVDGAEGPGRKHGLLRRDFGLRGRVGTSPAASVRVLAFGKVREARRHADAVGELLSAMGCARR